MALAGFASLIVSASLKGLASTWRSEASGSEHFDALRRKKEPFVFALWHGRMLLPIWRHRRQGVATMASRSKDGEIIARWLGRNGYRVVRGSTRKGGARGILELKRSLDAGRPAALTVDGPKGPPRLVQEGIVTLARRAQAWILPISASASRPRFLRSWDRYLVPKPFSRTIVVYGEAFRIDRETDEEAAEKIKDAIDSATAEADRRLGVRPPAPW